ncbi:hypothetical protein ACHAXT_012269 [Thalassiosira profunda]
MPALFDSVQSSLGVFEGTDDSGHGHDFCKAIAARVMTEAEFPVECKQYSDAVTLFRHHRSLARSGDAYAGMSPGDRTDAMRAKDEGHLNSAQIKRRMTTKKNGRFY